MTLEQQSESSMILTQTVPKKRGGPSKKLQNDETRSRKKPDRRIRNPQPTVYLDSDIQQLIDPLSPDATKNLATLEQ